MFPDVLFALAQGASQTGRPNTTMFILQMVGIGAIFYFLLIRPRRKQEKAHRERLKELQKGDHVVTAGGIQGRVIRVKDKVVTLKSGESTLEVVLDRVTEIVGEDTGTKAEK